MRWQNIESLKKEAAQSAVHGAVFAQLTAKTEKSTKQGKPYLELAFADCSAQFSLKIWDNSPLYSHCSGMELTSNWELSALWQVSAYGIEAADLNMRPLAEGEIAELLAGDAALIERQEADWAQIREFVASMADPRLRALCEALFQHFGARLRRCAAARGYHHVRRGGLVEHTAGMMRAAHALCPLYPELNRDLLLAGALFHDSGKMWENNYQENSFQMPFTLVGELLGHIPMGIELINKLWTLVFTPENKELWQQLSPANDEVRLHLLHLVAAHHGEIQFGSPVVPKTPEAAILHYIDNMDAKIEMFRCGYAESAQLAPQVQQKRMPLPGNLVSPLTHFPTPS